MRVRARMMKGIKMNHKSSHLDNLSCSFCYGTMEESREHLEEECPGCDFKRREPEDEHLERKTDILEKLDRVVEQLVDGSISSTLTQNHV